MKWRIASLLALLVQIRPITADACGIKLTIKTTTPRKAVARSSNPSHMLILGTPPRRLERELSAAGHDVETAPDVGSAKRDSYAVVVTDEAHEGEARAKFGKATIVVRSGNVANDIASVEGQVERRPIRSDESRAVVAAREARRPIAAGPTVQTRELVAARTETTATTDSSPPPVTPTPPAPAITAPAPKQVETPAPRPTPVAPAPAVATTERPRPETRPAPAPKAATVAPVASVHEELYFGVGSASVGNKAALDRAVHALKGSSVEVAVEGFADPTGTPEGNMALSQTRAESVRDYLVSAGVELSRITVTAFGDTKLKYGRDDSRNRRVAIHPK
jgi:outer membrane protein OmpA-like peptidoglycan-associated protein